jgi:hypothetical protein
MKVDGKQLKEREPKVQQIREFLEIVRDYTDPRDAIREAISNALDWGAKRIDVTVAQDKKRPDEELVITVQDDGIGLNEERLKAFFDLGNSTPLGKEHNFWKVGYKGHGTKTYFNCRCLEVFSNSDLCTVYAIMDDPLHKLMQDKLPKYYYDVDYEHKGKKTGTKIIIRNYNMSNNVPDFGHKALLDYVIWFTRFGSVETQFGFNQHKDCIITLKGLGSSKQEVLKFGHRFPQENHNIKKLTSDRPGDWTKVFVKRWLFPNKQIIGHPGKTLDLIFYVEGDQAKRTYNPMIRVRGKTHEHGMYKVEERYGLWACRDYIPIERKNEWLGLGKRLETKYHAFVNCQDFRLTANRGDIGNTPFEFLNAVQKTVEQIFNSEITGSAEYQEYDAAAELEQQYQSAEQELQDFGRRRKRSRTKKVCTFKGVELIEPGVEMGVIALFNQIYALDPSVFPFRVVDYDTKRGYDALVSKKTPADLSKEALYFIEFKYVLDATFNHSFDHLSNVICWDCGLSDGDELRDIRDKHRELKITPPKEKKEYTRHMLISSTEPLNIEVFILKTYLKERLGLEFRSRQSS